MVGFIDDSTNEGLKILRIDEGGGSYPYDLSLRLKRADVKNFSEVFFFTDKDEIHFSFRACAETIQFRKWTEKDIWLK